MTRELLIRQFSRCSDENGWFVSIENAIDGLTAEQAEWKPAGLDLSIRKYLSHVHYYNYAYLRRFRGEEYRYTKADNDATFQPETTWEEESKDFAAMMSEWRSMLAAADESKFEETVPTKTDGTKWKDLISDINAHNAYHAGEILLLRKLQGSWKPEKGVS